MKVLYVSGFEDGKHIDDHAGINENNTLIKPFTPQQLLNQIRRLLDEPATSLLS
jgi:hypothetical protein